MERAFFKGSVLEGIIIKHDIVHPTVFEAHRKQEIIALAKVNACQFAFQKYTFFRLVFLILPVFMLQE